MNVPLIIWSIVAGLFAVAMLVRLTRACVVCIRRNHPLVDLGRERDEFFIPGDKPESDDESYDDEHSDTT